MQSGTGLSSIALDPSGHLETGVVEAYGEGYRRGESRRE